MKAVVLEIRKNEAAVLCKDGQIVKIRRTGLTIGDTIDISDAEICPDKKVVFYKKLRQYGSVAAAAALLLGFGGNHIYNTAIACSYVSLDINPSIEYTLNRQDCVLDVTAVNEDAQEIVEQLKEQGIKKEPLADAISMTADLLQENGYITEDETDYILINVSSDSNKKSKSLKKEAQSVFDKLNIENEDNIHLTMTESTVSERKEARELGISAGEYKEIKAIGDEDVSKYKDMKVKDLLENSGQSNSSKEAVKNTDDSQKNEQKNIPKGNVQSNQQEKEAKSTEVKENTETREDTNKQSLSDSDQSITDQGNTEQNIQNWNSTGQNENGQAEQQNTDNNTGNFGQSSDNSHVEDSQDSAPQQNQDNGGAGVNRQEPGTLE